MDAFLNAIIKKRKPSQAVRNSNVRSDSGDDSVKPAKKVSGVEDILLRPDTKIESTQLGSKCHKKKRSKLKGIAKLEDANMAGTKSSSDCTLILTEGDSAKTFAISGLSVIGRDKFGVYPLRGKLLNVREATRKQIMADDDVSNIVKIVGLEYEKKYQSVEDLKSLRYGRIMLMMNQDGNGFHAKGLLINFIHHFWPELLKLPFLEEFITPFVKAVKGNTEKSFYSVPEFEEWKKEAENYNSWKIKYYKGLGTSTCKEAREYFSNLSRHRIKFNYSGTDDDNSIELAFSKKYVDQRKEWLTNGKEEIKQRHELRLPEGYLYGKDTTSITYQDLINKELILFSNMNNEQSIPSLVDGLQPLQRKVIFTCLKRNDKRELKVAQLAGSVAEQSAYPYREHSVTSTIVRLAQNFVGSNNINLLQPIGQFGTRLQGGKDSTNPRYIYTMLSSLAKHIFNPKDFPLLNYFTDDNQKIEPEYYVPTIPMILVNGCEGIGAGWMTKIPNYNPREIIANIRRLIKGEELETMTPWFKNFRGTIEPCERQQYVTSGKVAVLDEKSVEITELPIGTWTQTYKESVLEPMLHGDGKVSALITDYKEYHTDTSVKFVVTLPEKAEKEGLDKKFKLQSTVTTNTMVLFDHKGCLKKYESVDDIMKEFYQVRLQFYHKRKNYLEGMLKAELSKLLNQARFILEKIEGKIVIENRKKVDVIGELIKRGYASDPVRAWKKQQNKEKLLDDSENENSDYSQSGFDFDYLVGMSMWHLTKEKKGELMEQREVKVEELHVLQRKSAHDLWEEDLFALLKELDTVEEKERQDEADSVIVKAIEREELVLSPAKKPKIVQKEIKQEKLALSPAKKQKIVQKEIKPLPNPKVDPELKVKVEKVAVKRKQIKKEVDENGNDSHSEPKLLSERKLSAEKKVLFQPTLSLKRESKSSPVPRKRRKRRSRSSSYDSHEQRSDFSDTD